MKKQKTIDELRYEYEISVTAAMEMGDMRKLGRLYKKASDDGNTRLYYEAIEAYKKLHGELSRYAAE